MQDIIEMPDGTKVDMTGAPPEAHEALKKKIQGMVPDDSIWGKVKTGATAIARGATDAVASAGDTAGFVLGLTDESPWGKEAPLQALRRKYLPDSKNPGYVESALQGVGGAMVTGPRSLVNYMAGAGGGAGAKFGQEVGGTPGAVVGGIVGGIAGGGAAALASRVRPQSGNMAREAVEGITEADLGKAQVYMNRMKAEGTQIDLSQAVAATTNGETNLTSIRNFLANRSQGNKVQDLLKSQPQQLSTEARLTAESLPGTNYSNLENANNLQQTATERLKQATDSRSARVKADYAKAGDLPPDSANRLGAVLNKFATQPGSTDVLKARAKEMADKLIGGDPKLQQAVANAQAAVAGATNASGRAAAQQQLAAANSALTSAKGAPLKALDVDTWIGELSGPWKGQSLKEAYPKERGQVKGLAGALNREFQTLSPEVRAAEAKFRSITEQEINPLKQGPVGTLNQPHGFDPATQAVVSKFTGMLNTGSDPDAKVSALATTVKELAKINPEAVKSSFKGWISEKIKPVKGEAVGENSLPNDPKMAGRLWSSLFEDPHQWQGVKDVTAGIAKSEGRDPAELVRGLESLKKLTFAMKSRPDKVGGLSPSDFQQLGGNSNMANAVRVFSFLPANRLGEAIERATLSKTLSQFDDILTSPQGAELLIKLGKLPPTSREAQVLLGTFGAGLGNSSTD
jgi:hypothetical protein